MAFDLDPNYKDVPARIADFKEKHPEGSLRPLNPERPWEIVTVDSQTFIVYCAAAFRHPDDPAPGVGTAWELVPGKTPYTKLSELQNAETSAWGRAIVAVLASESKAVASAEDIRNRQADHAEPTAPVSGFLATFNDLDPATKNKVLPWLRERGCKPTNVPDELIPEVEAFIASLGTGPVTLPEASPEGAEINASPPGRVVGEGRDPAVLPETVSDRPALGKFKDKAGKA